MAIGFRLNWRALFAGCALLLGSVAAQAAEVASAASIPGHEMTLNGVRYHVGDQGTGERVVLLLHGMPDTSAVWRHQVKALVDAGYRVIVPDMLGYGETEKPQDVARYRGELIIGDMLALLDALKLKQVDVIGHDWGAFVSWELALNAPERVRRHVALSVGHPDLMLAVKSVAEVKDSWYMYLNAQADAAALYALNDGAFFKNYFIPTHPEVDEVWARMKDPLAMNGMLNWDKANPMASSFLAVFANPGQPRKSHVPTLGIWSSGDTYLWEAQMKDSAALMAAPWKYVRLEGPSHWLMLEQPEVVNRLVLDWLSQP